MKRFLLIVKFFLAGASASLAQNVAINNTGSQSDASAILDVNSTTKGLLIPRMTSVQRTAIATPATGLQVYQTDGTKGFYYFDGTAWIQIGTRGAGSYTAGAGIDITGNNLSAKNATALWNANQLQGKGISPVAPTAGQVLKYDAASAKWIPSTPASVNNSWGLSGNAGINSNTNYLGTTDATALNLSTAGITRMTVAAAGNIGINNSTPSAILDLRRGSNNANQFLFNMEDYTSNNAFASMSLYNSGNNTLFQGGKTGNGYLMYLSRINSASGSDGLYVNNGGIGSAVYGRCDDTGTGVSGYSQGGRGGYFLGGDLGLYASGNTGAIINGKRDGLDINVSQNPQSVNYYGVNCEMNTKSTGSVTGISSLIRAGNTPTVIGIYSYPIGTGAFVTAVEGIGNMNITGSYYSSSDKKLKQNIKPMGSVINKIMQLKPSTYQYKTAEFKLNLPKENQNGLVAQELQQVFPELVAEQVVPEQKDNKTGKVISEEMRYLGVNYTGLIPIVISGMQEQEQKIKVLETENAQLKKDIAAIKSKLGL